MPDEMRVTISFTESAAFRRLVDFAGAVERHADEACDVELQGLVHDLHDNLRDAYRGE